jgi:hypothetical protein
VLLTDLRNNAPKLLRKILGYVKAKSIKKITTKKYQLNQQIQCRKTVIEYAPLQ